MFYVNSLLLMSIFVHLWMSGAYSMLLYEGSAESTESTALFLCSRFSVLLLCLCLFRIAFYLNEKIYLSCQSESKQTL